MKLNEISVKLAVRRILSRVEPNSPNYISNAGELFDNYNSYEYFTDENGNELPFLNWIALVYKEFKSRNLDDNTIKEYLFYFLLPVKKKLPIPDNYKYLKVKKRLLSGKITEVAIELSRRTALDIMLTDMLETIIDKKYEIALVDTANESALKIFKNKNLICNEDMMNELNKLSKNNTLKENKLFSVIFDNANKARIKNSYSTFLKDAK